MLSRRDILRYCVAAGVLVRPGFAMASNGAAKGEAAAVAFVGVTVIPMDRERLLEAQTVIVRGDRIVAMGPAATTAAPTDARIIDGRGKFLMPGLADMHVHIRRASDLPLYLANGVTTVRNMVGTPQHLRWRKLVSEGDLPGPAMVTAGPALGGPQRRRRRARAGVLTVSEAERSVADQKESGYDFIKIYDHLTPEVYGAIVRAAARHGMTIAGHVPFAVGLDKVIAAGQRSIEHLSGFAALIQRADSPVRGRTDWPSRFLAYSHMDDSRIGPVARSIRDAGIWSCPTLVASGRLMPGKYAGKWLSRPEMRHVDARTRKLWSVLRFRRNRVWDVAAADRAVNVRLKMTGALHRAGAKILLGTDAMAPFVVPGFAIHDELANLVAAGLTPFAALRAGTSGAAEFLGQPFGAVAVGRRADLLLLAGNPLKQLTTLKQPTGVMVRGRWLPAAALKRLLETHAGSNTPKQPRKTRRQAPRDKP